MSGAGAGGLPAPPQSVPYAYLHQSAGVVAFKFYGAIALCIAAVILVCWVVAYVQRATDHSETVDEIRDRFEKRGKYADERWPHER